MKVFSLAVSAILLLSSCNKTAGSGQHATVELRDGTSVTGTVLSSSASELQIAGDDKVTRTIPMSQVRSIEYDDAAEAAVGSTPAAAAAPVAPRVPASKRELRHREHYHPVETAITTKTYELPAGTEISVRNEETIDSGKVTEGQTFPAEVTKDVLDAAGNVVIPAGTNAQIVIRSASKGGKIRGASDLVLDLASISIDGRQYQLSTADLTEKGHNGIGANRRTGEFAGGGAAIGAIIGAIAGGGKGAAIGAGSGAGAGALTEVLTFKLDQALRVRAAQ
jgi:hypothetical protein